MYTPGKRKKKMEFETAYKQQKNVVLSTSSNHKVAQTGTMPSRRVNINHFGP